MEKTWLDVEKLEKRGINYIQKPKDCPRWKHLPTHDCEECPDACETCIMITGEWINEM